MAHVEAFVSRGGSGARHQAHVTCVRGFASALVERARKGEVIERGPWLAVDMHTKAIREGRLKVAASEKAHVEKALAAFLDHLARSKPV